MAFLNWLRITTERAWSDRDDWALSDFTQAGRLGPRWRPGTRWTGGLDQTTIEQVEAKYAVRFPWQHRLFLSTLHSTTPWQRCADYAHRGDRLSLRETPGFYNWLHDEDEIRSKMAAARENRETVTEVLAALDHGKRSAPCSELLPIYGHRYVVADSSQRVLSIVDGDVVVVRKRSPRLPTP